MFRPEVVLSRKAGSISYLWRVIPDLGTNFVPRMARQRDRPVLGGRASGAVQQRRPLIFGREATSHGPVRVLRS